MTEFDNENESESLVIIMQNIVISNTETEDQGVNERATTATQRMSGQQSHNYRFAAINRGEENIHKKGRDLELKNSKI